eukprot:gene34990-43096_t
MSRLRRAYPTVIITISATSAVLLDEAESLLRATRLTATGPTRTYAAVRTGAPLSGAGAHGTAAHSAPYRKHGAADCAADDGAFALPHRVVRIRQGDEVSVYTDFAPCNAKRSGDLC